MQRIFVDGKFLQAGNRRFWVKGVTYGTFAPDAEAVSFRRRPGRRDFAAMARAGRQHGPGLHAALARDARRSRADGLRVMVGLPWSQHVAFLDDRALRREHPARHRPAGRELGDHPAVLMFALGNEIPPGVVRWHGRMRVERFLRTLVRRRPKTPRPTACSRTSTFRRRDISISRSSTSARSTSTCTASRSCARISRGCSTSPARSRCCWPRRAPTAFAKGRTARPRSRRCTSAPRSRKARAARSRSRGPTSGGAAATTSTTGSSGWSIASAARSRRPPPSPTRSRDAPFSRRARSARGRASRSSSAPTTPPTRSRDYLSSLEQLDLSRLRDHPRQRRLDAIGRAIAHAGRAPRSSARARHRHPERRPERRAQRRPGRRDRRDRRLHRRRHARRSRLADVSRPAVPHVRRRRLRRTERRAARRSADRAVHRARAGRPDARAARRSHRRARARLQHGVPPRRAARDRRLQPDLPPRRRRCGCVLAAAGARLEDRVRVGGARLASPSRVGQGATGASRSATAKAKRG